jgi:putative transposon-encoded protein
MLESTSLNGLMHIKFCSSNPACIELLRLDQNICRHPSRLTNGFVEHIMPHESMKKKDHKMAHPSADNKIVKSIGASGQISLGKEFAGRQVLVESPAKGVWIIRTATITPDHEPWVPEKSAKSGAKKNLQNKTKSPIQRAQSKSPD